ncbi:MAG: hypothetical protein ACI4EN_03655 [Butyrivibrio sp.]
MILKDLKRQIISLGMILSLVVGLVMLCVGFYPEITSYFKLGLLIKYDYLALLMKALTSGGFLVFTPIVVVLPGVMQFCDDYKYGYSRFIITRVSKKKFLIQRYIATVIAGGVACMLPLLVFSVMALIFCDAPADYSRVDYSVIYSGFASMWEGKAVMAHVCLYGFIFGIVWASIGMMFAVMIPNRYAALGFPVVIFCIANIICNLFGAYKFSPVNMLLVDIQDSQGFVLAYQGILLVVSLIVYLFVGNRRLKNA